MTRASAKTSYQDFIISDASAIKPLRLVRHWLRLKVHLPLRAFHGTSVRRVGRNKIEVTFDLPPKVRQQMHQAIRAGKQIRLYVP